VGALPSLSSLPSDPCTLYFFPLPSLCAVFPKRVTKAQLQASVEERGEDELIKQTLKNVREYSREESCQKIPELR